MLGHKVALRGEHLDRGVLVALAKGSSGALTHHLHELELDGNVVLTLAPVLVLLEVVGAVNRQHLGAGLLHHEALLGGVHRLVGIGGGVAVYAVADEDAHVVARQVKQGRLPDAREVAVHELVSGVDVGVTCVLRKRHAAQLGEQRAVDLDAEQARKQAIGVGAAVHGTGELGEFRGNDGCGCGHGLSP